MDGQRVAGPAPAPRFPETTTELEKKFLEGRQNRADELESAVRYFLEFLKGFESLHVTDSPEEAVDIILRSDRDSPRQQ